MHETGHLLGLSNRYDEYLGDNQIPKNTIIGHKGFENDIMGRQAGNPKAKLGFNSIYYKFYIKLGNNISPVTNMNVINGQIDINEYGHRLTPYEKGGIHRKEYEGELKNGIEFWKNDFLLK